MIGPVRAALVLLATACAAPAYADHHPAYVIPGKPGVPVIIDGVDASYGVVEGDWGLHRPGAGVRTVYPSYWVRTVRGAGYFPATGRIPAYGRDEIEPRGTRRPAPSYRRTWTTGSVTPVADLPGREWEIPSTGAGDPRRIGHNGDQMRHGKQDRRRPRR